tara:strand:+ start:571 stop:1005 length:435 start_codon:yes stop_codon:yes gene_type:complete
MKEDLTLKEAQKLDLHVGDIIEVTGHTITGDGGDCKYEVVAGATHPEGACGVFEFDNGVQGEVIFKCDEPTINPLKYSGGCMNKYEVQESEEGHYRLDYIVVDKTKPKYHIDDVNKELEPIWYDITCHCKDESMANLICEALNK